MTASLLTPDEIATLQALFAKATGGLAFDLPTRSNHGNPAVWRHYLLQSLAAAHAKEMAERRGR